MYIVQQTIPLPLATFCMYILCIQIVSPCSYCGKQNTVRGSLYIIFSPVPCTTQLFQVVRGPPGPQWINVFFVSSKSEANNFHPNQVDEA